MNKFDYKNLTPFKWFVLENFPFIEADFDALTNWQLFCKLGKEMNKIIDSQNTVGTQMENLTNAFIELENYINNYFENLDVQEEINNKLDEMADNGFFDYYFNSFISENIEEITRSVGDTTVYILKVPFNNQNNQRNTIKIGIGNDLDTPNNREDPLKFFQRKHATALINGGLTDQETGYFLGNNLMIDGQDLQSVPTNHFYSLGIRNDGTLTAYAPNVTKEQIIADGCQNTVGGYYPILQNGEYVGQEILNEMGESWDTLKYPRSAIAQTSDKTIYLLSCSGKDVNGQSGLTYKEVADVLLGLLDNVQFAYALDGGGSATIVHRGTMLNVPTDSDGRTYRSLHSMLYIANDLITQHDIDINYLNYISGRNRRSIDTIRADIPYTDKFKIGVLELLNPSNVNYEGINIYENGEHITKLNLEEKRLAYFNYLRNKAIVDFNVDLDRWVFNGVTMAKIVEQLNNAEVTDLNETTKSGFYFAPSSNTVLNKPVNTRAYHIICLASSNGGFVHQIALPFTASENIFYRFKRTGGWDAWKELQFVTPET